MHHSYLALWWSQRIKFIHSFKISRQQERQYRQFIQTTLCINTPQYSFTQRRVKHMSVQTFFRATLRSLFTQRQDPWYYCPIQVYTFPQINVLKIQLYILLWLRLVLKWPLSSCSLFYYLKTNSLSLYLYCKLDQCSCPFSNSRRILSLTLSMGSNRQKNKWCGKSSGSPSQ